MTDHQPPPAVEAIGRLEELAGWLARGDDGAEGSVLLAASVAQEHSADLRLVLSELRHSVEREAGLREALAYLAGEKNDAGERAWDGRAGDA